MTSAEWFERARRVVPGGVNSPVRAFQAVGGTPPYMARGKGAVLTTVDGQELIDFCCSWGPLILGHARTEVVTAVAEAAGRGMSFGANTTAEVEFAELLVSRIPSAEQVRLVSSGTEATMTALRLARGITGRSKIIKFSGGYHGHSDGLLVAAGSGLLTGGMSSSAGVGDELAHNVLIPPYNDLGAVEEIAARHGQDLAAIIVEPVAGNMGMVPPAEGFLEGLRRAASSCGALLVFDEVITGFRLGATTFGAIRGVTPDLTCLGKIIGGGMPIGAIAGPAALMENLAPLGPVYQAGTLSGNPVAVAAGRATLELLIAENPYPAIGRKAARLATGLEQLAEKHGISLHGAVLGSMFTPFFAPSPVGCLADAKTCDVGAFARFFQGMLKRGVYLPPSQFETAFVSSAHTDEQIDRFLAAADGSLAETVAHERSPDCPSRNPARRSQPCHADHGGGDRRDLRGTLGLGGSRLPAVRCATPRRGSRTACPQRRAEDHPRSPLPWRGAPCGGGHSAGSRSVLPRPPRGGCPRGTPLRRLARARCRRGRPRLPGRNQSAVKESRETDSAFQPPSPVSSRRRRQPVWFNAS